MKLLILGGTSEARALAAALVDRGVDVTSSLAGRVADPALPAGAVRIGGFGGPAGLAEFLRGNDIAAVVDATHPFAATMTASAVTACGAAGVPLLRLARPGWGDHPDAPTWHWVDGYAEAAARTASLGHRVFLTSGRTTLQHFRSLDDRFVLVRLVDAPDANFPAEWLAIRSRGPYTDAGEQALLSEHRIDVLVTKDSGGSLTAPKLTAARAEQVPVVIVRRPPTPPLVQQVSTVADAVDWVAHR